MTEICRGKKGLTVEGEVWPLRLIVDRNASGTGNRKVKVNPAWLSDQKKGAGANR